jgi:erythromycin esterase
VSAAPIVGVGENSHGVAEFKTLAHRLTPRLVADHGYRLVAVEGTLGGFAPIDDYVAGGHTDLDAAMASIEFYFWRTDEVRRLFEWLRAFNADRPSEDRVVVRGYDAQFHDVNATAIRRYLERVDPDYLSTVDEDLNPLTRPLYERHDASFATDTQIDLVESLAARLRSHRSEYVAESSVAAWRLARRHVWTLERGLRFQKHLRAEAYTAGKRIRDEAMAANVSWLRGWTGADRAVVLGNANHTMRNGPESEVAPRMGQHLADEYGDDYYAVGLLFGTGRFTAPTDSDRTSFDTHPLGEPNDGTPAQTLVDVSPDPVFLDFETARRREPIADWLAATEGVQFTVPSAAARGAVSLPAPPGTVYDGVALVPTVSPASFAE